MRKSHQAIAYQVTTSKPSWDWLRLGRTAGMRSAEIVAGLRTLPLASTKDEALSTPMGRWFAHLLINLTNDAASINATSGRHICMTHLALQALNHGSSPRVIVELAAGFSARGLQLAQAFPQADVIEVDLPDVVEAKSARIARLTGGNLPGNLRWVSADLSTVQLEQVLGVQKVDLVIAEGVLPYFPPALITQVAVSVQQNLVENGRFIADVISTQGWRETENKSKLAVWLLKRQIGKFKGKAEESAQARQWFEEAGYRKVTAYPLCELAAKFVPNLPVADVSFIVEAHKGESTKG
ncbi:MAG: class I SAM-dependent methyltransferase [Chloroflexota bacterium]